MTASELDLDWMASSQSCSLIGLGLSNETSHNPRRGKVFKQPLLSFRVSLPRTGSDPPSRVTTEPLHLRVTWVVLQVRNVQERGGVVVLNQLYELPRYMGGAVQQRLICNCPLLSCLR